jgi:exopolysaccharide biosynthesis protein
MVYFDGSGARYKQNAPDFSGGLVAGIVNYPGLVSDGNVQIDDNQSGLSDKQKIKNTKIGLGIRGENTVLVVAAYNVNMQEFAYVFKSLGATGALNLDTGGSAAIYYSGSYIIGPGRHLPNAVIFARR